MRRTVQPDLVLPCMVQGYYQCFFAREIRGQAGTTDQAVRPLRGPRAGTGHWRMLGGRSQGHAFHLQDRDIAIGVRVSLLLPHPVTAANKRRYDRSFLWGRPCSTWLRSALRRPQTIPARSAPQEHRRVPRLCGIARTCMKLGGRRLREWRSLRARF